MRCKTCGASSEQVFRASIPGKHDVAYYRCKNCDFLQTKEPYWIEEAHSSAISDLDLGPVDRATRSTRVVEALIVTAFDPNARFVDRGGGYVVFTRLMRDRGYDHDWHDQHYQNRFAKRFLAEPGVGCKLATRFEVFERLIQGTTPADRQRWRNVV